MENVRNMIIKGLDTGVREKFFMHVDNGIRDNIYRHCNVLDQQLYHRLGVNIYNRIIMTLNNQRPWRT